MQVRKRAQENDAVSTAHADDIKWIADTTQSMKLSYQKKDANGNPVLSPNGDVIYDVDGFANEFQKRLSDRRKAQMKSMPTGDAQQGYYDATLNLYGSSYQHAMTWENMTKAVTYKQNFEVRNNTQSNLLINNPDLTLANESIEQMRAELNRSIGNVNTPGEAQELFNSGARIRILGLMNGYANNATTARQGLNVLNHITQTAPRDSRTGELIMGQETGYPEKGAVISKTTEGGKTTTTVSGGGMRKGIYGSGLDATLVQQSLTSSEIRHFRDRYEAIIKQGNQHNLADLRGWARDQKALLTSTDPRDFDRVSPSETKQRLDEMKQMVDDGTIARREFEDTVVSVTLGRAYNMVRNEYAMMPPSSKADFDSRLRQEYDAELKLLNIPSKGFAFDEVKDYRALNDRVWNHMMEQRNKDIAAYVEANGQGVRGSITDGVPDEARLRWRMGQAVSIEHPGELWTKGELKGHVANLKQEAQDSPQRAAQHLWSIKERSGGFAGQAMSDLVAKGHLPSYFQEAFFMDNPRVAETMIQNQEPKTKAALEKSLPSTDKKSLADKVEASFRATGAAFRGSGGDRFAGDLKEAVRLEAIRIKGAEVGTSDKDAVDQAMNEIVHSQYHLVNTAFIPKNIGNVQTNIEYIKGEMQAIYNPQVLDRLGVDAPRSRDGKADRGMSIAMGRWMTNPDNLGMTFKVKVGNDWTPVYTRDHKSVQIDFVKASVDPSPEALDYVKPWWESLFSGAPNPQGKTQVITSDAIATGGAQDDYASISPEAKRKSAEKLGMKGEFGDAVLAAVRDPGQIKTKEYDPKSGKTRITLKSGKSFVLSGDLRDVRGK